MLPYGYAYSKAQEPGGCRPYGYAATLCACRTYVRVVPTAMSCVRLCRPYGYVRASLPLRLCRPYAATLRLCLRLCRACFPTAVSNLCACRTYVRVVRAAVSNLPKAR